MEFEFMPQIFYKLCEFADVTFVDQETL